jgi:hypothetical protein
MRTAIKRGVIIFGGAAVLSLMEWTIKAVL